MGGGNENTRTAAPKRTTAARASPSKNKKDGDRKYQNDVKCSVDVGPKNRPQANTPNRGPARAEKFQKGGGSADKTVKSTSDAPKDPRARACAKWVDDVLAMGIKGIRKDFVINVKGYIPLGEKQACLRENDLNRYDDVFCLDESRVKLRSNPDGDTDYIHANFVKVQPELVYIAAQGPLPSSVPHFWYMILQENVKVVLQLCQLMEDGKEKCNEYYPAPADGTEWKTYGSVEVRVTERNTNVAGMKKVTKSKMQVKLDNRVHDLTHIFYYGWPDHAVAESVGTCREVRNLVHRTYEKKPIVCHCSAGIGRTGTFVMIELVVHRLLTKHDADFKTSEIVKELRNQRMHSVQNDQQYLFVFRCTLEILLAEDVIPKSPEVTKFIEDYDSFVQRKKKEREKNKGHQTV